MKNGSRLLLKIHQQKINASVQSKPIEQHPLAKRLGEQFFFDQFFHTTKSFRAENNTLVNPQSNSAKLVELNCFEFPMSDSKTQFSVLYAYSLHCNWFDLNRDYQYFNILFDLDKFVLFDNCIVLVQLAWDKFKSNQNNLNPFRAILINNLINQTTISERARMATDENPLFTKLLCKAKRFAVKFVLFLLKHD